MTDAKLKALIDKVTDLSIEELAELQKMVTHVLGFKRSIAVLAGGLERPGKRGKRWKKVK